MSSPEENFPSPSTNHTFVMTPCYGNVVKGNKFILTPVTPKSPIPNQVSIVKATPSSPVIPTLVQHTPDTKISSSKSFQQDVIQKPQIDIVFEQFRKNGVPVLESSCESVASKNNIPASHHNETTNTVSKLITVLKPLGAKVVRDKSKDTFAIYLPNSSLEHQDVADGQVSKPYDNQQIHQNAESGLKDHTKYKLVKKEGLLTLVEDPGSPPATSSDTQRYNTVDYRIIIKHQFELQ